MAPDRLACIAFAVCIAVFILVKSAAWLALAAGRLILDWIFHALNEPH